MAEPRSLSEISLSTIVRSPFFNLLLLLKSDNKFLLTFGRDSDCYAIHSDLVTLTIDSHWFAAIAC